MTCPRVSRLKLAALVIAAAVAVAAGVTTYAAGAWPGLEAQTLDARFGVRGPVHLPSDVVVVGIDDKTFDAAPAGLGHAWPLPRRFDAGVIDRLRADGARVIAFDVQFTEPTDPADDNALFDAVARAGNVVLATTEVDAAGQTDVLGGSANLRAAHAVAAAANTPADADRVIRRYPYRIIGLPSFATAVARAAGHPVPAAAFPPGGALIDFPGPPHTVPMVSFADVYHGRVDPRTFAGKVVVVGAVSPTLQDLHLTSTTSSSPMTGAELQAAAISTALHGNPLRPAPWWLGLLATVLAALLAPLCALRLRVLAALAVSATLAGAYLVISQLAFDGGTVLTQRVLPAAVGQRARARPPAGPGGGVPGHRDRRAHPAHRRAVPAAGAGDRLEQDRRRDAHVRQHGP